MFRKLLQELGFVDLASLVAATFAALWVLIHTKPAQIETHESETLEEKVRDFFVWVGKFSCTVVIAFYAGAGMSRMFGTSVEVQRVASIIAAMGLQSFFKNFDRIVISIWEKWKR